MKRKTNQYLFNFQNYYRAGRSVEDRHLRKVEAAGSNPAQSTVSFFHYLLIINTQNLIIMHYRCTRYTNLTNHFIFCMLLTTYGTIWHLIKLSTSLTTSAVLETYQ